MELTTSPGRKWTRRDLKVGTEILQMAGYGAPRVIAVLKVVKREKGQMLVKAVKNDGLVPLESWWEYDKDTSWYVKSGLWRLDVENLGDDWLIKPRVMTPAESNEADKAAKKWDAFTKSETYQSM